MEIGVTGHRPGRLGGYSSEIYDRLTDFAMEYFEPKKGQDIRIHTGMALGWDLAVARAAWNLQIPFVAHVPYPQQSDQWDTDWKFRWASLMDAAVERITYSKVFNPRVMDERNKGIVSAADRMVVLYDGVQMGGTASTIWYTKQAGKEYDNLWDQWSKAE